MTINAIRSVRDSSAPVPVALDTTRSRKAAAGALPPPEAGSLPPGRLQAGDSPNEGHDDYRAVVAVLNDRWRVIACTAGIQWILQVRRGRLWRGRSYCRSKAGLLGCVRDYCGAVDPAAMSVLALLPDWIEASR